MTAIASQLTNLTIVHSTVYSGAAKKAWTSHVIITTANIGSAWRDWTHVAWQGLNINCESRDMRKMSQSGLVMKQTKQYLSRRRNTSRHRKIHIAKYSALEYAHPR